MSLRTHIVLVLLAIMSQWTAPTQAATFCAATGNQLNQALATAGANSQDDIIKIEHGTLTTDVNTPQTEQWSYRPFTEAELDFNVTISGGWSKGNNCQSQTSLEPSETQLDARSWGPVFSLELPLVNGTGYSGTFSMSNLSLVRGRSYDAMATGLHVQGTVNIGASLVFDNLLVTTGAENSANPYLTSAVFASLTGSGFFRFRNSIVYANQNDASAVNINMTGTTVGFVSNNTIFGNAGKTMGPGLSFSGVGTLSNNAIAGNTSTAASYYQMYSEAPTGMTLRNNHFQTKQFYGGVPNSETGTTTGDPQWTLVGVTPVPNTSSPLRDSGMNNPPGGMLGIDYDGGARVINTTIDRGAIEATAVPPAGPAVTPSTPANNSTSTLPNGVYGNAVYQSLSFNVSGGINGGTTQLVCAKTAGTVASITFGNQTIAIAGTVNPVRVYFTLTNAPQTGTVQCTATPQNGAPSTYTYHFSAPAGALLGPTISAAAPVESAVMHFAPTAPGDLVELSINLSASDGHPNGVTSIDCFDLVGPVVVSVNAAQSVVTGQQPLPVTATMAATLADQEGIVRCLVKRHPDQPASTLQYQILVAPASGLFADSFE